MGRLREGLTGLKRADSLILYNENTEISKPPYLKKNPYVLYKNKK